MVLVYKTISKIIKLFKIIKPFCSINTNIKIISKINFRIRLIVDLQISIIKDNSKYNQEATNSKISRYNKTMRIYLILQFQILHSMIINTIKFQKLLNSIIDKMIIKLINKNVNIIPYFIQTLFYFIILNKIYLYRNNAKCS